VKKGKEMKLNPEMEEFKREELPGRYIVKLLYGWDNKNLMKNIWKNWRGIGIDGKMIERKERRST